MIIQDRNLSDLDIFREFLPEGDDQAWITCSDEYTRLVDMNKFINKLENRSLRINKIYRRGRISPCGKYIHWPGGAFLEYNSISSAKDNQYIDLLALIPAHQRFRPLKAIISHSEPSVYEYTDVRPQNVLINILDLKANDIINIINSHAPAETDLVLARLSDLTVTISAWFSGCQLANLIRRPWPYAIRCYPDRAPMETIFGCLKSGRIDLVERPLIYLINDG